MTRDEALARSVVEKYEKLRLSRSPFERDWQDIRDLVRPIYGGYNTTTGQHYTFRTESMYDSTAPDALEDLASGLHGYLTSPEERWFGLEVEGDYEAMQDPEVLAWLEIVSDMIYACYSVEEAAFNPAMHEAYLDVGSFGTSIVSQEWDRKLGVPIFRAYPIQDCYISEDSKGRVDGVYRIICWDLRRIRQEFGDMLPPNLMKVKDEQRMFDILHAVFPRTDRDVKRLDAKNKPYYSCYVCVQTGELLSEGGYDELPYHVGRWTKLAGEMYGRSPAKKCLPDIKMLNAMEKLIIKAGTKAVDPPLIVPDDGFLLPIDTSPGSLIFKEPGAEQPEALRFEGALPWAEEKAEQKRALIRKAFYSEWMKMDKQNVEMTAYEVADRRDEKLRHMAPTLGRLVSELHGPMVKRTYSLLSKHNRVPPAPAQLQGSILKVGYSSPASRAQTGVKAVAMGRFIQELVPLAQIDPTVMDVVNADRYAIELAKARGTPRMILRSAEEIAEVRNQRQQKEQMAALAGAAEPVSKAVKNLADAQVTGAPIV